METLFGIIALGTEDILDENTGQNISSVAYKERDQLDKLLERLWLQDQIEPFSKLSAEEGCGKTLFVNISERSQSFYSKDSTNRKCS